MEVKVLFHDMKPSAALRSQGHKVAHFHLSRFGREVTGVHLSLRPAAKDGLGAGLRCQITVQRPNARVTKVDVISADPILAMEAAADWAAQAVARVLEERRNDLANVGCASRP